MQVKHSTSESRRRNAALEAHGSRPMRSTRRKVVSSVPRLSRDAHRAPGAQHLASRRTRQAQVRRARRPSNSDFPAQHAPLRGRSGSSATSSAGRSLATGSLGYYLPFVSCPVNSSAAAADRPGRNLAADTPGLLRKLAGDAVQWRGEVPAPSLLSRCRIVP